MKAFLLTFAVLGAINTAAAIWHGFNGSPPITKGIRAGSAVLIFVLTAWAIWLL